MIDQGLQNDNFAREGMVLFIDKPLDWTSFDVVRKIRALFKVRRVGHAGTLDPKATGLLIVCIGEKTKTVEKYIGMEKEYIGTFELGVRTPSFDTETAVYERKEFHDITDIQIQNAATDFLGVQQQLPPMYSAVKYDGKPLYRYARVGRTIDRVKREIKINTFDILDINKPFVNFRVVCSKGTYIRTLIDELGQKIGCGASLIALRRVRIGNISIENAMTIDQIIEWRNKLNIEVQLNNAIYSTER
jgi:tRNA pseudouridine55 synthase